MEAVAPHPVLLIVAVRDGVCIGVRRHCLMEAAVKYSHHGRIRHKPLTNFDSFHIRWIVERGEVKKFPEDRYHLVGNQDGTGAFFSRALR